MLVLAPETRSGGSRLQSGESLRDELLAKVETMAPILTQHFESSVPGLYFIGAAAAASFGPMMRFTFGARYAARRLTRALVESQRASEKSFAESSIDGHAETPV